MQKTCAEIAKIIKHNVEGIELDESNYEANLIDLGMDSMTFIQIIVEIEEQFEIEIPDEYLLYGKMETVNKMATVVWTIEKDTGR